MKKSLNRLSDFLDAENNTDIDPPKKKLQQPKIVSVADNTKVNNTVAPRRDDQKSIALSKKRVSANMLEQAKDAYYNPRVIPGITSGDSSLDFLYRNNWLMDIPVVGNVIKDKAYKMASNSSGMGTIDTKTKGGGEGAGHYDGTLPSEGTVPEQKNPAKLLDVYFGKATLPKSKYKPKDDYLDFLPSYSIKDNVNEEGYKDFPKVLGSLGVKPNADFTKPIYSNQHVDERDSLSNFLGSDLGHYKASVAFDDKKKLPYLSVSDAWDFEPGTYKKLWSTGVHEAENKEKEDKAYIQSSLMHKAGKPFKVYDRFYFDPKTKQYIPDKAMDNSRGKKKKYAFGTGLSSVGEVPSVGGLVNETASNFLMTQALSGLGTIFGDNPIDMPMGNMFKDQTGFTFANGGVVGANQRAVEVEGGEVAETPYGDMMQFSGPSHEAGGIDASLPVGTTIYSDRIAIDGKTMQERKKARESRIKKLEKAGGTPADKNTLERTMAFLDLEEEGDLMIQEAANNAQDKFAYGGIIGDPTKPRVPFLDAMNPEPDYMGQILQATGLPSAQINNNTLPALPTGERIQSPGIIGTPVIPGIKAPKTSPSTKVPLSEGDVTGMFGNAIGGIAPLLTTMANRAGDTPNVNAYENFGQDALMANAGAKSQVAGIRDNSLRSTKLKETAARSRNRNSASSVNTLRALDLATDATADQAEGDIQAQYASQLMNLFSQQAGLENQQDSAVMAGDQAADLADRQDRDAYFTNLADNFVNLGNAVQKQGKDLNVNSQNNDIMSLLPSLSKYGLGYIYDENNNPVLTKIK